MKKRFFVLLVPLVFVFISLFFFRSYLFNNKTLAPFNLLVSFYSPWKYEQGYGIGIPNKPLGNDNIKLFYPMRKYTTDQLKKGTIPLWNPYFFSGSVHVGTYQSAIFYPFNLLYLFLRQMDVWSILIIIQPVLAGWFMYLFLKSLKMKSLQISNNASLLGAIGFAFSGWMIAYWQEVLVVEHTILWLPLVLYVTNLLLDKPTNRLYGLFLVLSLCMPLLAGFPQMSVYLLLTVLVWSLHRGGLLIVLKYIFTAVLLTAFQWLPALEALQLAPRNIVDNSHLFKTFLSPIHHLITFLAPDFWGNPGTYNYFSRVIYLQERTIFIGIPLFVFALYALRKRAIPMFWKIFTLITLSMGFQLPTSWLPHLLHIPILSVGMPVRVFILATFGLCILSAYGIDAYLKEKKYDKKMQGVLLFLGLVIACLWLYVGYMLMLSKKSDYLATLDAEQLKIILSYASVSIRNLILPTLIFSVTFGAIRFIKKPLVLLFVIATLSILGSYHMANKLLYYSDSKFEYPTATPIQKLKELAGINRVWSYGDGYVVRNLLMYFGLYSAEGYEALYSHRYATFLGTIMTRGVLTDEIHRTDATLSETGQYESMTHNPTRLRAMAITGTKYILEHKDSNADKVILPTERFPENLFTLVWENEGWRIWEYEQVLPRAYIVHKTTVETDAQKIITTILDENTNLRNVAVVENQDAYVNEIESDTDSAEIIRYEPSTVEISTDSRTEGLLFLSDTYYPGWHAYVDGIESKIYRTNYTFRGVLVPAGKHDVKFVYDPTSWKLGLYISGIGSVLFVLQLMVSKKKNEKN